MTEQDFIALLYRFEKGLCTPEEKIRLEKWLDGMLKKEKSFMSDTERESMQTALRKSIYERSGLAAMKRRVRTYTWMKVAATILLLALACYTFFETDFFSREGQEMAIEAPVDDIKKVILSDGSIVWLRSESRLSYPQTFSGDERVVRLAGEALFEVAKDAEHPFVIHTGDLTTRVLGTSFNIRSTSEHTEVYVYTGRVSVSVPGTNEEMELLPQQKMMYSHASNQLKKQHLSIEEDEPLEYMKGTDYNMYFQDVSITEIAGRIEKKFDVEVILEGDVSPCVLTADLTDQSLTGTLDLIAEAISARYRIEGGRITLTGDGCR